MISFSGNQIASSSSSNGSTSSAGLSGFPAYSMDFKNLFSRYQRKFSCTLSKFKEAWKEMGFSIIHEAKPEWQSSADFLQTLYIIAMGFFHVNRHVNVRCGVLYCLYLLYETQHNDPKIKIIVSMATFQQIVHFIKREVIPLSIVDAFQVFQKMKNNNYICYSALPPVIEGITNAPSSGALEHPSPDVINVNTVSGVVDLDLIDKIAAEYAMSKGQTVVTDNKNPDITTPTQSSSLSIVNTQLPMDIRQILAQRTIETIAGSLVPREGASVQMQQTTPEARGKRNQIRKQDYSNKKKDRMAAYRKAPENVPTTRSITRSISTESSDEELQTPQQLPAFLSGLADIPKSPGVTSQKKRKQPGKDKEEKEKDMDEEDEEFAQSLIESLEQENVEQKRNKRTRSNKSKDKQTETTSEPKKRRKTSQTKETSDTETSKKNKLKDSVDADANVTKPNKATENAGMDEKTKKSKNDLNSDTIYIASNSSPRIIQNASKKSISLSNSSNSITASTTDIPAQSSDTTQTSTNLGDSVGNRTRSRLRQSSETL